MKPHLRELPPSLCGPPIGQLWVWILRRTDGTEQLLMPMVGREEDHAERFRDFAEAAARAHGGQAMLVRFARA